MTHRLLFTAGAAVLVVACNPDSRAPTQAPTPPAGTANARAFELQNPGPHIMLRRGHVRPGLSLGAAPPSGNGIDYHGGPIIYTQKVAAIYWSDRTIYPGGPAPGTNGPGSADGSVLGFFMSHLGGSPYYNINTTYYDGTGTQVQNSVTYTQYWAANTVALDADTKLAITYLVGQRDAGEATVFMRDLVSRLANRVQLTTDGFPGYLKAVEQAFGWNEVDYAMLVKLYGPGLETDRGYSPPVCTGAIKSWAMGKPDKASVSEPSG